MLELSVACLATVLYGEASTLDQKIAVGSVVIKSAGSIKNICDEVYKPHRYEYIDLMRAGKLDPPSKKDLLQNELIALDIIRGKYKLKPYTHFHDNRVKNPWGYQPKEIIGALTFY